MCYRYVFKERANRELYLLYFIISIKIHEMNRNKLR